MSDYISRMITELGELHVRASKLLDFTETDRFEGLPDDSRQDLVDQLDLMTDYERVLSRRIARTFGNEI